jgi:tetratricopeptide (TPR) repeat protein
MKRKQKIMLIVLLLLLALLLAELLFRPRTVFSSLAQMLYKQQRYESAAKIFDRYKEDEAAAANLAKSRYQQGEYQQAQEASEAALKKQPDNAESLYDRGNIAFKEEDYSKAVEYFEEALLKDPTDNDARANLELALQRLAEKPPPPAPEPKPDKDKREEEEVRNMLEALDNLEARERKNQRRQEIPKTDHWW